MVSISRSTVVRTKVHGINAATAIQIRGIMQYLPASLVILRQKWTMSIMKFRDTSITVMHAWLAIPTAMHREHLITVQPDFR
jgi:hypothetical protein